MGEATRVQVLGLARARPNLQFGAPMEHEVLRKLRAAMRSARHDALVAFSQDNVTYTAGFLVPSHASNRFRRTITVTSNSPAGAAPTISALRGRRLLAPSSRTCFTVLILVLLSTRSIQSANLAFLRKKHLRKSWRSLGLRRRLAGDPQVDHLIEQIEPERRTQQDGERGDQNPKKF